MSNRRPPPHRRQPSFSPPLRPTTPPPESTVTPSRSRPPTHSATTPATRTHPRLAQTVTPQLPFQSSFPTPQLPNPNKQANHTLPHPSDEALADASFSPSKARFRARQTARLAVLRDWVVSLVDRSSPGDDTNVSGDPGHGKAVKGVDHDGLIVDKHDDRDAETKRRRERVLALFDSWEAEYLALSLNQQHHQPSLSSPAPSSDDVPSTSITTSDLAAASLEALQDLMAWETRSRERNRRVGAAKREELGLLLSSRRSYCEDGGEGGEQGGSGLIGVLEGSLSPGARRALDSLAETAVALGVPLSSPADGMRGDKRKKTSVLEELACAVFEVTSRLQGLQMRVHEVATARNKVEAEIDGVRRVEMEVARRGKVVKTLEEEIKGFHGLPPDLEASKQEVRRAEAELQRLRLRREKVMQQIEGRI